MTSKLGVVPFNPEVWPRPWGEEVLVIHTELYTGKLLKMKKGTRGGLQKHRVKDEAQYVLSGSLLLEYDEGDGVIRSLTLGPGQALHIPPGTVHRETALEDSVIFEVSNAVFNDRERCEPLYGEEIPAGGLPTTSLDEIRIGKDKRPL